MNRTGVIICAVMATLILLTIGSGAYLYRHFATRGKLLSQPQAHGVEFLCELDPASELNSTNLISEFREATRIRFATAGWRIYFEQISGTRVRITTPKLDVDGILNARDLLTKRGKLQFRFVHDDSDELVRNNSIPAGYELLSCGRLGGIEQMLVRIRINPELNGILVEEARMTRDKLGRPQISIRLNPQATAGCAAITRQNVGRRLAIVIDGELMTAPRINSPIEGGGAVIEGEYTEREASELANALASPLPVNVSVLESNSF